MAGGVEEEEAAVAEYFLMEDKESTFLSSADGEGEREETAGE